MSCSNPFHSENLNSAMMEAAAYVRSVALAALAVMEDESDDEEQVRRWGVHPINKERPLLGAFRTNFFQLKNYPEKFRIVYRVSPDQFQELLYLMEPKLRRKRNSSHPISPEERLAVTLHYLGSGSTLKHLAVLYKLGHSTVIKIVDETSAAIWETLSPNYVKVPNKPSDWLRISQEFATMWQFPHTVGAVDGKHIRMKCPGKTGSVYINYKGYFSLVLLAVADARYRFIFVDIGGVGGSNDAGLFATSDIQKILREENLPPPDIIDGIELKMPYFTVADDAFALNKSMMKPFGGGELSREKQIFNLRLSRARRCVENSFGILSQRWRIFLTGFDCSPERVKARTKACVALHNYLSKDSPTAEWADKMKDVTTESENLKSVSPTKARNSSNEAKLIREKLTAWCVGPGALDWQDSHIVTPI